MTEKERSPDRVMETPLSRAMKGIGRVLDGTEVRVYFPGVYNLFQEQVFGRSFGQRIAFASELSDYLEANYYGRDRGLLYEELLEIGIVYERSSVGAKSRSETGILIPPKSE